MPLIRIEIHVVQKGSWKNEKSKSLKLESFQSSWKVTIEAEKFWM